MPRSTRQEGKYRETIPVGFWDADFPLRHPTFHLGGPIPGRANRKMADLKLKSRKRCCVSGSGIAWTARVF
jgi:hypothetical protein